MGPQGATIREESTGKKCINARSILRLKHLQKLATWADKEVSVPPLSAFFGCLLAAHAEVAGAPLDPLLFPCARCETILQPGYNCTIRIDKNEIKARPCKISCDSTQNSIVYKCHFCSHRNLKGGTPTGHMKELLATRPRGMSISKTQGSVDTKSGNVMKKVAAMGKLYKNKQEGISLNLKSVSASELSCSGKIVAAKDITKSRMVTAMEKSGMNFSKKKSKGSISGSDRGATSAGKILNTSKKSKKSVCNPKETPKSSEHKSKKSRTLVISIKKKGSILSKKKRRASISKLDELTATTSCFDATDVDKASGTRRKRRKLLSVIDEIPKINEHQDLVCAHSMESPSTPSEKLGNKSSRKRKKVNASGSDKQSTGHNCSAATDSGKFIGGSSRRKRKLWHHLKDITESDEHGSTLSNNNLAISFPVTSLHDMPLMKQKERHRSMKVLNKWTKSKKIAKSDKKLSSGEMPSRKRQIKCKKGQSAEASISSTSNELKSFVQQTDDLCGSHCRNLVSGRSMNYCPTMNTSGFHFVSQQSAPVTTAHQLPCWNPSSNSSIGLQPPVAMAGHHLHCLNLGSNVAYTQLSPVVAANQLHYLSQGSGASAAMQSPSIIMYGDQHNCLSQVSNVAAMQQTPAVMASHQLHFLAQGLNMSAMQQSPLALDHQNCHFSPVCNTSAVLQSPIVTVGHQLHCLGQGPNMIVMQQSPVTMAAHQLHSLGQGSYLPCMQQSPVVISGHQIHHSNQESSGAMLQPPAFVADHQLHNLSQGWNPVHGEP